MNLQIQCPSCEKQFAVHEDLTGKTVECGSCDHRFKVKPESVVSERSKIYPGEHREDAFLNRLGKSGGGGTSAVGKVHEAHVPQVDSIMPASAAHTIAAIAGASLITLYGLVFFLGTKPDGIFQDVPLEKRLILGGFVALVGIGLLIFGAKNWKIKSVLLSLILGGGLMAMVFSSPVHLTPTVDQATGVEIKTPTAMVDKPLNEVDIKSKVGYLGMQRKIDEMSAKHGINGIDYVIGIFIADLSGSDFHEIEKYLKSVLNIPATEGISRYQRNNESDSLIVIAGLKLDFDTVVRYCERLGQTTTYPEIRLIDLKKTSSLFADPDEDQLRKMTSPDHPAFFAQNLGELSALAPDRVKAAVGRLASVPAEIELRHGEKIVQELIRILSRSEDPLLLSDVGNALRVWGGANSSGVEIASRRVNAWIERDAIIPSSIVEYLIDNSAEKAPLFVDLLWSNDPSSWSKTYVSLGSIGEPQLLAHLGGAKAKLKKEALPILAKIGTSKSLPALQKLVSGSEIELRILAERAVEGIKAR